MASSFKLSNNNSQFSLDTEGNVNDANGQKIGAWNTDRQNNLVIQKPANSDGTVPPPIVIPVKWSFNPNNQFCLQQGNGTVLLNFNADETVIPEYELRNAVLRVRPDMTKDFQFFITGDWNMTPDHLLQFTVNGVTSTIDGVLADTKSRFIYNFRDKTRSFVSSRLTFSGAWQQQTVDGVPKLSFTYNLADGSTKTFALPGDLVISKGSNQFKYSYNKNDRSFGVSLLGFLKISENLIISYTLDKQSSQNGDELVATTTFTMQAAFVGKQFEGDLNLALIRDDNTPGNYTLAVTGEYTGVVGDTRVMVGFRFSQIRANGKVTRTVGIGGAFILKNGQISYLLDVGQNTISLTLGVEIRLKSGAAVDSKLNITSENGEVQSINFLLGVSF